MGSLLTMKDEWIQNHAGENIVDGLIDSCSQKIDMVEEGTVDSIASDVEAWKQNAIATVESSGVPGSAVLIAALRGKTLYLLYSIDELNPNCAKHYFLQHLIQNWR